jgi:hypothetical protein
VSAASQIAKVTARCALLVVVAAAATTVHVPRAQAATPCWKTLLNDWYDGRIDGTYARHCYTDALKHLPADVQTYSSAHDDILRALQSAMAKAKKQGKNLGPNAPIAAPTSGHTSGGKKTTSTSTTTPVVTGRKPPGGLTGIADKANNSGASGVPVPLLVLGGLALLLVAAGGVGLLVKRLQGRKPAP